MQPEISQERRLYLRKNRLDRVLVFATQISLLTLFVILWETLANTGVIDSFITSSPSKIIKTFMNLSQNGLVEHFLVTCKETIIGFSLRYIYRYIYCNYSLVVKFLI